MKGRKIQNEAAMRPIMTSTDRLERVRSCGVVGEAISLFFYGSSSSSCSIDCLIAATNAGGSAKSRSVTWNSDTNTPSRSTTIKRYPGFTARAYTNRLGKTPILRTLVG